MKRTILLACVGLGTLIVCLIIASDHKKLHKQTEKERISSEYISVTNELRNAVQGNTVLSPPEQSKLKEKQQILATQYEALTHTILTIEVK